MRSNLCELLVQEKVLSPEQVQSVLDFKGRKDVPISTAIVSLGFLSEEEMAQALSRQLGYPYINLDQFEVYQDVVKLIPVDVAKKHLVIPVHQIRSFLTLAMVDPTDLDIIEDIRFRTGLSIQPIIASETGIMNSIKKLYDSSDSLRVKQIVDEIEQSHEISVNIIEEEKEDYDIEELVHSTEEAPVITLVNTIFIDAIKKGASDIHFEPNEKSLRVRYRLDGTLYEMMNLAAKFKNPVGSRVKILSNMDIAEKRLPQDGRVKMRAKLETGTIKEVDMRVSSVPAVSGEKIVVRILDKAMLKLNLGELGFEKESMERFKEAIVKPWGIILVTGPTGSGKTNTLYSAISSINSVEKNIMTAEDPVEFHVPGINQINIKEEIGLTFSTSLRSFLRQDPDIMLVGEMRDFETVDIAIKAALTGHLVFSTIHTNDASSTILRLVNMNVEPFLIADSVLMIVAQRLVRRLCKKCCIEHDLSPEVLVDIGFGPEEAKQVKAYKHYGCNECNNTGYKGRIALYEVMPANGDIKEMILTRAQSNEIKKKAIEQGMITLRQSGLIKIKAGITSVEEVLRETVKD
ncbi:type IV-A pilus assembly ATPase PilB [Acidobacteriota bacterium]